MCHVFKSFASLGLALLLSSCQVVDQAVEAGRSLITDNTPISIDISPWKPFQPLLLQPMPKHSGEVLAVRQVSSTPPQLVSAGTDGNAIGWELSSGSGYLLKGLGRSVEVATIGQELPLMAYVADGKVFVTCITQCQGDWVLDRLKPRVIDVAFHEHDSALLIAGADGRIYRWRFEVDRLATSLKERDKGLERYIAHQTLLSHVAAHPSGRAFFSTDWDGMLFGWLPYTADSHQGEYDRNLFGGRFFGGTGNFFKAPRAVDRGISSIAVSATGERLAIGTEDGSVEVWDVRGFSLAAKKTHHTGRVTSVAISSDGMTVASVSRDAQLVIGRLAQDERFRISPQALPFTLQDVLTQTLAHGTGNLLFLSNDNLIFSTKDGRIGEIDLAHVKPIAAPTPQPGPSAYSPTSADPDY